MSLQLVKDYQKALDAIYEHVGFQEDWVVCPLDDKTDYYWFIINDKSTVKHTVKFANSLEDLFSQGEYYEDDIYTQSFYSKWVYEGEDFTMIFCDPHVDGMKWWRLFDNKKKVDLKLERKYKLGNIEDEK